MDVIGLTSFGLGYEELVHISTSYDEEHGAYSTWSGDADVRRTLDGSKSHCILLQFTGLKDEEGHEIYEDDVLTLRTGDPDPEKGENPFSLGAISWVDGRFIFITKKDVLEMHECLIVGMWDGKRIGSIYDNPDLLK